MSKYIDKEVLLERMNRTRPYEGADGSFERHRRLQWLADIGQVNMCPTADVVEKEKYDRLLENSLIVSSALQKYQKADVVEVVRCKDCIYHTGDDECTHGRWDIWSDNSDYELYPEALEMDYCSYGVRKGERNVCSDRD